MGAVSKWMPSCFDQAGVVSGASFRRTFRLAHSLCLHAWMAMGSPHLQHVWSELLQYTLPLVAEQHCTVQISGSNVYKLDPPVEKETAPRRSRAMHCTVIRVA